jgi:hypothetical protein
LFQNDTPLEQISLICRRAFADTAGKMFIVLHAEKIKFDNGMMLEQVTDFTNLRFG